MSLLLAAALAASSQPFPFIDRTWLDARAKVEIIRTRKAAVVRTSVRRSALPSNDLTVLGAVCNAAAKMPDPAGFLNKLGAAYSMSTGEIASLRESCAIYLAGRAESGF